MNSLENCDDNVLIESFGGTLKNTLVRYETSDQVRHVITKCVEIFCNYQRFQARLGCLSPAAFAQQFPWP